MKMTPRERIAAKYAAGEYGHSDTFSFDVEGHGVGGWVIDRPGFFVMWRCVVKEWPLGMMQSHFFRVPESDTVWIWAASGDIRMVAECILETCPTVKWVGYERRGKPRLWEVERFLGGKGRRG